MMLSHGPSLSALPRPGYDADRALAGPEPLGDVSADDDRRAVGAHSAIEKSRPPMRRMPSVLDMPGRTR